VSATATPYGVLNAGTWTLWCRTCPWRTRPTPVGPDVASFRAVRQAAEQAWRNHAHETEGAPAGRLVEVGSAPPAIFPEVA
jgi:hypothetical protein